MKMLGRHRGRPLAGGGPAEPIRRQHDRGRGSRCRACGSGAGEPASAGRTMGGVLRAAAAPHLALAVLDVNGCLAPRRSLNALMAALFFDGRARFLHLNYVLLTDHTIGEWERLC